MSCSELECEELPQSCGCMNAIQMEEPDLNTKPEKAQIFVLFHMNEVNLKGTHANLISIPRNLAYKRSLVKVFEL